MFNADFFGLDLVPPQSIHQTLTQQNLLSRNLRCTLERGTKINFSMNANAPLLSEGKTTRLNQNSMKLRPE